MRLKKIIRVTTVPQSLNDFCKIMLGELTEWYEVVGISSSGKDLDEVAVREGVRVVAVEMERHISVWKDLKSLVEMVKVFRREKPDMVHSMTPKAGLISMMAGWMTGVPVRVHTFTGLVWPTSTGLKRIVLKMTDRVTCACATHVIPEGEGVMNDLRDGRITRKPMKVLGYGNVKGVDMERFSRREEVMKIAEGLKDDKFKFLFVGRIVGDKGINELVEAFESVKKSVGQVGLVLVGPYENDLDPLKPETQRVIESDEDIETVGSKSGDELLGYFAAADCFVMPSYREGFPNTVMEAGAMGLPSIVTDINGSREIVKDGVNGVVVPSKSAEALAEAMARMIKDEKLRETCQENARRMIEERFEQHFVRKCLYDFYQEIL